MAENDFSQMKQRVKGIKELYECVLVRRQKSKLREITEFIISLQNSDGSWGIQECREYHGDIITDFYFTPTYYATAVLMYAELMGCYHESLSPGKGPLSRGLEIAVLRKLGGHGFGAMREKLENINIYKKAGLYDWMIDHQEHKFTRMMVGIMSDFEKLLETENTVSDWNEEFRDDFEDVVWSYKQYYKNKL